LSRRRATLVHVLDVSTPNAHGIRSQLDLLDAAGGSAQTNS